MPGKATRTWVLVADGSRAKVMETGGPGSGYREVEDMAFSIDLPKSREILADKPGRTFERVGAARHAKENTADPHRELKRDFARRLVTELRQAMMARRFDQVVLVAPPTFMGDLRDGLPKDLRDKVAKEVTADLTKVPQQQLYKQLDDMLGAG